ncbi:MAG: IS91 family transposase [bacterium]
MAEIFRAHGEAYRQRHRLSPEQRCAMRAIETCRTAVLGGHLDHCVRCGHEQPSYNSCRNRHCPKCQALAQARWIDRRKEHILPLPYFHVVFTLPAELRPLARLNRTRVFDALFAAVAATLQQLARDPKRLGATLGFTAVLHTWTRDLRFHPHLHCVVTAGGLAPEGDRWIVGSPRFLFPVRVLARLYRGKLVATLRRAHRQEPFALSDDAPGVFTRLLDRVMAMDWVVYAKAPFRGADHVYEYLGRYTHRVAISNARLIAVEPEAITFRTKEGRRATLAPGEFIRRFLEHVLPLGFVKSRHYGLLASGARQRFAIEQRLLEPNPPAQSPETKSSTWADLLLRLTARDPRVCPRCGHAPLRCTLLVPQPRTPRSRDPPAS